MSFTTTVLENSEISSHLSGRIDVRIITPKFIFIFLSNLFCSCDRLRSLAKELQELVCETAGVRRFDLPQWKASCIHSAVAWIWNKF